MPSRRRLGTRTALVYQFIVDYKAEHDGVSPKIRDIMENTGHKSTSTVDYDLNKLINAGFLNKHEGSIMVVGAHWSPPVDRHHVHGSLMVPVKQS